MHPNRFAVMGKLDPDAPDARDRLRTWRAQPGMLGFRFTLKRQLQTLLTEGHMDWVWPEAETARLPIYVSVTQSTVHLIDAIAERHPGLPLVIDHLAIESDKQKDEEAFRNLDNVLAVAKRPNVAVKVTAMPCYTTDDYPYRKLHPYLRRVYDAFSPKRMFWAGPPPPSPGPPPPSSPMFSPWAPRVFPLWILGGGFWGGLGGGGWGVVADRRCLVGGLGGEPPGAAWGGFGGLPGKGRLTVFGLGVRV